MQFCVPSCKDAHDCKPDPAMAGLGIRLYYITIEGSDAAGNIGRDQCRVIIIPRNMSIQQADVIVQKSSVRYPIVATTDMGIMLEDKTNILLGYMYDLGQALFDKIDATQSTTNRARERGLTEDDEVKDSTMLHENTPTSNINMKQRVKIEAELWMAVAAVVGCVAFGFVAGIGTVFVFKILPK
jgi:hypothetical protein